MALLFTTCTMDYNSADLDNQAVQLISCTLLFISFLSVTVGSWISKPPLGAKFLLLNSGNTLTTPWHKLWHLKTSAFQYGIANATAVDGRRGSNVYEVNPWLWQFGRGRPRLAARRGDE